MSEKTNLSATEQVDQLVAAGLTRKAAASIVSDGFLAQAKADEQTAKWEAFKAGSSS